MSGPESAPEIAAADPIGPSRPPRSRLRRVVGYAVDAALVIALAATVFLAYGLIGNRWYHIIAIEGGSMEPTITRGDLIVVTPLESDIQPGMILTMGIGGKIVTHRVIAVLPDGSIVTRGDANDLDDDWQGKPITVFGEYAFTIPALGRFLPVNNASGASFADQETATQRIEVGHWTIAGPDPVVARPPVTTPTSEPTSGPTPIVPTPTPEPTSVPTPTEPTPTEPTPTEPPVAEPTLGPPAPTPEPTSVPTPAEPPPAEPTPEPPLDPAPGP